MRRTIIALALIGSMVGAGGDVVRAQECEVYTITAYSAQEYPGRTADGTSTWQAINEGEPIAAGSWNLPLGTVVAVSGMGTYTIRDRGHLESRHIDILTATTWEALQIGRQYRRVCVIQL